MASAKHQRSQGTMTKRNYPSRNNTSLAEVDRMRSLRISRSLESRIQTVTAGRRFQTRHRFARSTQYRKHLIKILAGDQRERVLRGHVFGRIQRTGGCGITDLCRDDVRTNLICSVSHAEHCIVCVSRRQGASLYAPISANDTRHRARRAESAQ